VGGVFLFTAGHPSATPAPSGPSTARPTAPLGAPVPAPLVAGWYGTDRTFPGIAPKAGTTLFLGENDMRFTQSNDQTTPRVRSGASIVAGQLQLVSTTDTSYAGGSCLQGTVGMYSYTVSDSGNVLRLLANSDECAQRPALLNGTWWKKACLKDGACYGVLDAGTYGTQYFDPRVKPNGTWGPNYAAVSFTVPDGWAQAEDFPGFTRLELASDYAREAGGTDPSTLPTITIVGEPFGQPDGDLCETQSTPKADDPRSPADLVAYLKSQPWIDASGQQSLNLDGHAAIQIDVAFHAGAKGGCPADPTPNGRYLTGYGSDTWGFGIEGSRRARVVLIDLGNGDVAGVVIEAPTQAAFDSFATQAMQLVSTLHFE
jgi:hypothetical protein